MKIPNFLFKIIGFGVTLVIFPLVIFWVGYSQIYPLFRGEFTQYLGSIEVSYIQMAKFIATSLPNFAWQPKWYLGYPMAVLYTPLVPFFEFFANILVGWSYGHAYRVLTAFSFVGGLITLYFFGRELFKNSVSGLFTSLCYGILPSIIAYFYSEVANDKFLIDIVEPRRFTILVRWGEGPHIVSLLFLPIAALFFIRFLRTGGKFSLIAGALFSALVALTNSVGAWGLAILFLSLIVGEVSEKSSLWRAILGRTIIIGVLSFGFVAFWFNPLFLSTFFREGGSSLANLRNLFPWGWLAGIGILVIYFLLSRKLLSKLPGTAGIILYFMIMFWLVNTYYASGSEKIELVPQVLRLTTEVDLAASLLVGMVISVIGIILMKKANWIYYIGMVVILLGILPLGATQLALIAEDLPRFARSGDMVHADLLKTAEYEVAKNLESKIIGDERVFVPGNYGFFLNNFTDVPQLRGALFQSSVNNWPDHIYYQVTNGKDADVSLAWLKIANIGWFVYGGSREIFRDFQVGAAKFDNVLEFIEEKNGDRFYQVPLKNTSLAKLVPREIEGVKTPVNAIDKVPIFNYVSLLEQYDNTLSLTEKENGNFNISGEIDNDKMILVQQSFVPGWRAWDNSGQRLDVKSDPFGFILIKPKQNGAQTIKLIYGKTWRIYFGWVVTAVAAISTIFIIFKVKSPISSNTIADKKTERDEE